ncbi:hypothetical protein TrCOL_g10357 [Triparma columacea]|uniref:Uncharacterized protein n=1 Tax=Triparma columacea TaxID=722753 RepID=A0A9W7GMA3_9STRA|nr:hypothetical protein TrCOL_g10357 [Triparma columacea]
MDEDDGLDPDAKILPSQKYGLMTSARVYKEHQAAVKAGTRRKSQLPLVDEAGNPLTLVGKAHWAEPAGISYVEKMRLRALPATYTKDSAMNLVPQQTIFADTTDTSLRDSAQSGKVMDLKFDTSAFSSDKIGGLQRDLYYVSPYLTCEECNGLVYIDAAKLRNRIALSKFGETVDEETGERVKDESWKLPPEPLPPCPGCGRTNTFRIGADDLTLLLAANVEELERRKRVQKRMAKKIQECYRYYLRRRYGRAQRHAIIIRRMLEKRCAAAIQAMVRARLARRRFVVEKALLVIKEAHKMLVNRALHWEGYHKRVFWYKTKTELAVLNEDYYMLVERTGFNPPLCVVEENICEIAKRIKDREYELACRLQARWRGIVVRRYLNVFKLEKTRAREIMAGCTFRLQRQWRGYLGRKRAALIRRGLKNDKLMDQYQTERFEKAEKLLIERENFKMKAHYTKERQEERSARFTGLTNPKMFDGKKMKAYFESSYGETNAKDTMDEFMENVFERKARDADLALEKHDRAESVRVMQSKDPLLHKYFDDEMRERREGIIKKLTKERPIRRVGKLLAQHNKKNIKFEYPQSCYNDPMAIIREDLIVKEVRRDKHGRRVRDTNDKAELLKFKEELEQKQFKENEKKFKSKFGTRRAGVTIETIETDKAQKAGAEPAHTADNVKDALAEMMDELG